MFETSASVAAFFASYLGCLSSAVSVAFMSCTSRNMAKSQRSVGAEMVVVPSVDSAQIGDICQRKMATPSISEASFWRVNYNAEA